MMNCTGLSMIRAIGLGLSIALLGSCSNSKKSSGPFTPAAQVNPSLDQRVIERAYRAGEANDFFAISGSQLNQDLILMGFERFMALQRGVLLTRQLRDNFTALGYFQQTTKAGLAELCNQDREFLALAAATSSLADRPKGYPVETIGCENGDTVVAVPLGFDAKIFAVSPLNTFANSIDLKVLAEASRKANGNLRWSDLNPEWPARLVRWAFPVHMPFTTHMQRLGVQLPDNLLLASNYTKIFEAANKDPDILIYSFFSPTLNARLQGSNFRILPVQNRLLGAPVMPSVKTIKKTYPEALETEIMLFVNTSRSKSCIALSFADFLLTFNELILYEQNMAPLLPETRRKTLKRLRQIEVSDDFQSIPFCQFAAQAQSSGKRSVGE